ncbi:hypothetical protein HYH02_005888 [Chlamydomonas schloesseri]|uniref:Uncharacterized protein n=1 Tax=Chlamydomonas schloesseri TaxID=2026947 RepID=A0A835WKL0_9CHLO|nr:hypothetical protein HYH02_005888 [Chlamydomonas schloesseri]|eukprot:KAG2449141.1 hypothetical protein HYH02_005888 [Chlamydomonas schloesseri]
MATNAEKLQLAESDLRKLDDEIAKNAEDRRQLLQVILSREKVKEDCEHLWQQMASLEVDRDNLQTDKKEKKLAVEHLKQTLAAEAADGAPSTIAAVPDADGPRDQQAAAHSSPAPLRGFGGYSLVLFHQQLRAFKANPICKAFVELPAWSRLYACSAQLGASPLLLLMHALTAVVRSWLGGIALQVAVFLATAAVEWLIMWLLFAVAQLLP